MPRQHRVRQGEDLTSIAIRYGFNPQTIWDDSANSELKRLRKNPNILMPGDIITIPDKRDREESGGTESRHSFVALGRTRTLKLELKNDEGEALANCDYRLRIDETWREGSTDGNGQLNEQIPIRARRALLIIDGKEIALRVATLDPISTVSGVQARLRNLGYHVEQNGQLDRRTITAMQAFQRANNIPESSEINDQTTSKLLELHGS